MLAAGDIEEECAQSFRGSNGITWKRRRNSQSYKSQLLGEVLAGASQKGQDLEPSRLPEEGLQVISFSLPQWPAAGLLLRLAVPYRKLPALSTHRKLQNVLVGAGDRCDQEMFLVHSLGCLIRKAPNLQSLIICYDFSSYSYPILYLQFGIIIFLKRVPQIV